MANRRRTAATLALLLGWAGSGAAQPGNRTTPTPGPDEIGSPCLPVYYQKTGATYVAANHLSGSFGAADIGVAGATTTIDVSAYAGTVVFSGVYHVRGNVRFTNGTAELRPGTVFFVEGQNTTTAIEVEDASLELTGAIIRSTCAGPWAGITLLSRGRIRTWADAAATAPAGRSAICDAYRGVYVSPQNNPYSSGEYYLNNTDFLNNLTGVFDYNKNVARAGEGMHYCTFSTDSGLKWSLPYANGYATMGIRLPSPDFPLGSNNYAAATIDHCSFHHLDCGIYGAGQQLRITDNAFDYIWMAALDLETGNGTGYFNQSPMHLLRNDIMVRGANPRGSANTYGIMGGVYAQGNYIHGDDANPAGNGVEQVGIFMNTPDNSTQTGNTFERLDKGIEAGVFGSGAQRDMSGNLFRDVQYGISMFAWPGSAMSPNDLFVRCNSFENRASLAGAAALNIEEHDFPYWLGEPSQGNGNRFVTPGLPFIEPILNPMGVPFTYWYFGTSSQESFAMATMNGYSPLPTGGNPATACTGAGHTNGISNRGTGTPGPLLVTATALQNAYDSLRLPGSAIRRNVLLNTVITAVNQQHDFASLEAYLTTLPAAADPVHAPLGVWLMHAYQRSRRDADAQRMQALLLARHAGNAEVRSSVQLAAVQARLGRAASSMAPPSATDVAALKALAASGTVAARVACPAARRFDPTCPCRFTTQATPQVLAARSATGKNEAALGALYPNPASGQVRVPYTLLPGTGPAQLEVRNALGQLVQRTSLTGATGEGLLDVRALPAGVYNCLLLVAGQRPQAQRFAVVH